MKRLAWLFLGLLSIIFFNGFSLFSSFDPKEEIARLEGSSWGDRTNIYLKRGDTLRFWHNDDGLVGSNGARNFLITQITPTGSHEYTMSVRFLGLESTHHVVLDEEKRRLTFTDAKFHHRSFYFTPSKRGSARETTPTKQAQEREEVPTQESIKLYTQANAYKYGIGVASDVEKALTLYRRAVEAGSVDAMVDLASYYQKGIWVKEDQTKAKALLEKASQAGSISAKWELEWMEEQ
jgi:hypothetical protein